MCMKVYLCDVHVTFVSGWSTASHVLGFSRYKELSQFAGLGIFEEHFVIYIKHAMYNQQG